jgi:hypothetical protein
MKRIVDGLTYNTDTSTLLAKAEWTLNDQWSPYNGSEVEGELYQTRGGAFFLVTTIHIPGDNSSDARDKVEFAAMPPDRAQAWLLEGDVEIYRNPFDDPPEATAEADAGATIYIRVPAALKRDVDEAAREEQVSGNVWAMRCVERCLSPKAKEKLGVAYAALTMIRAHSGEGLSPGQEGELLSEAIELVEGAWKTLGPSMGDIHNMTLSYEAEELTRRYPLYGDEKS